jgi:hypothetical protein
LLDRKDDAFIFLAESATIKPARPILRDSVPGRDLSNRILIGTVPTPSPTSNEQEPSFWQTHQEKLVTAGGAVASATGLQLYRLGNEPNAAESIAKLLKNIGFPEAAAEEAVNVGKVLAESRSGGKFALGLVVVGAGVALWKFWFGDDGTAHKQAVYVKPVTLQLPAQH